MSDAKPKQLAPLDLAEAILYPGIPYERLTTEQRFKTYDLAKQIVFERTGQKIPPTTPFRPATYVS